MRNHCHIWRINIKRVQAKQLSSAPPLKSSESLWFSDNSREFRSQIIHSNAPMDESLTHPVWTITLVFSSKRKILLEWKYVLLPNCSTFLFWILLRYLLNILSWQYFLVLFFCYVVPLLCSCSTIPWYSDFCQYSVVPLVFRCSAGVPCSVVRCSGVPSIIVCVFRKERTVLQIPRGDHDFGKNNINMATIGTCTACLKR